MEKTLRNESILERFIHGETIASIARDCGISVAVTHRVIHKTAHKQGRRTINRDKGLPVEVIVYGTDSRGRTVRLR